MMWQQLLYQLMLNPFEWLWRLSSPSKRKHHNVPYVLGEVFEDPIDDTLAHSYGVNLGVPINIQTYHADMLTPTYPLEVQGPACGLNTLPQKSYTLQATPIIVAYDHWPIQLSLLQVALTLPQASFPNFTLEKLGKPKVQSTLPPIQSQVSTSILEPLSAFKTRNVHSVPVAQLLKPKNNLIPTTLKVTASKDKTAVILACPIKRKAIPVHRLSSDVRRRCYQALREQAPELEDVRIHMLFDRFYPGLYEKVEFTREGPLKENVLNCMLNPPSKRKGKVSEAHFLVVGIPTQTEAGNNRYIQALVPQVEEA